MTLKFRNVRTIIVLSIACGVASYPRPEDLINKTSATAKNVPINKIDKAIYNLPNAENNKEVRKDDKRKLQRQGDDFTGSIEINSENVEGHVEIPLENKDNVEYDANKNAKGYVDLPNKPNYDGFVFESNKYSKNTHKITGNIEEHNGDIIGEIIIPDDGETIPDAGGGNSNDLVVPNGSDLPPHESENAQDDDSTLTGSIEINSNNVEGTINVPDDGKEPTHSSDGNGQYNGDDNIQSDGGVNNGITGSIEINDDNIEGSLEFTDEDTNQLDVGGSDGITGSIETNSENIEGSLNISDEDDKNVDHGIYPEIGEFSGNIEIDDEGNIEGEIRSSSGEDQVNSNFDKNGEYSYEDTPKSNKASENIGLPEKNKPSKDKTNDGESCWMNLNSKKYLDVLDELDAKYKKARQEYQNEIGPEFDKQMMEVLLKSQGKAPRAIHQAQGDPNIIPAGLNLGGFGMMRMQGSLLFFHRLKLRNDTRFQVNFLQANLMDMSLIGRLSLNDLHLQGAYERTTTEGDMSVMYFMPNYGELNVLLKDVKYKMEARLRMLNNRLMIELVNSAISAKDILLTYANSSSATKLLMQDNIDDFVDRLKSDLDLWLKDYFNDYLMYFGIIGGKSSEIQVYEKQKTIKVNEYADYAIKSIKKRIRDMGLENIKLPHLTIITATLQQVKLKSGILRGLDSMYRRSVATTKKEDNIRKVDAIIGFSNLKVEYQYEAILGPGQHALSGTLVLSADELTAHFELAQLDNSQTVSINVDTILQLKSESLTVEGPANRMIANFKFILENPIIAIMTNVMKHNIKMLKTLPGCEPRLWGEKGRKSQLTPYNPNNSHTYSTRKPAKISDETKTEEVYTPKSESEDLPYGLDEFPDREQEFIQNEEEVDRGWEDYVFSKNDSVEIEAPIDGKMQKLKLDRHENFVLSKLP